MHAECTTSDRLQYRGITLDSLRVLCDLLSNLAAAALPLKCCVSCCLRRSAASQYVNWGNSSGSGHGCFTRRRTHQVTANVPRITSDCRRSQDGSGRTVSPKLSQGQFSQPSGQPDGHVTADVESGWPHSSRAPSGGHQKPRSGGST